jgi:hypothetical protein
MNIKYAAVLTLIASASAVDPVNLGSSCNYAILSKTGIKIAADTGVKIYGNVGTSPAALSYNTGFAEFPTGDGAAATLAAEYSTSDLLGDGYYLYSVNHMPATKTAVDNAVGATLTAYNTGTGQVTDPTSDKITNHPCNFVDGNVLSPGIYKWDCVVTLPAGATLKFDGGPTDVWILQIAGNVVFHADSKTELTGGAKAENIFWTVAGDIAVNERAHVDAILLSMTSIAMLTESTLTGALYAQAQVALGTNVVVTGVQTGECAATPETSAVARLNLGSTPCIDKAVANVTETVGMDKYPIPPENFLNIDDQSGDSVQVTMNPDAFPGATAISVHYHVDVNTENCDVTTAFDGLVAYDAFCYAPEGQPKFTEISIIVRFAANPSIEDCQTCNPPPGGSADTVYFSFEVPCTSIPICETESPTSGPTAGPTECVPNDSLNPGSEYCPDASGVTALKVTGASSLPEDVDVLWDIQGSSDSESASVQFQVQNPFPASTKMFVKYHEPAGAVGASWAKACDEHELGLCGGTTSGPITAQCLRGDGSPFTLVHVYFVDFTDSLNDQIFGPVKIDKCCYPEDVPSENVAQYDFLVRCSCPEPILANTTRRRLRSERDDYSFAEADVSAMVAMWEEEHQL